MELELNSKPKSLIRCRLETIWVWDEMEVQVEVGESGGGELWKRGVCQTEEMDEEMWAKLPCHLLEGHILYQLPLESLFRFRSVCTSWNLLIFSDEFLKRYYEQVSSDPNSIPLASNVIDITRILRGTVP